MSNTVEWNAHVTGRIKLGPVERLILEQRLVSIGFKCGPWFSLKDDPEQEARFFRKGSLGIGVDRAGEVWVWRFLDKTRKYQKRFYRISDKYTARLISELMGDNYERAESGFKKGKYRSRTRPGKE